MASRLTEQVIEFHKTYGVPIAETPAFPSKERRELRMDLLAEEVSEYADAEAADDFLEVADALGDMCVIIMGTALEYGIDLDAVLEEIHRSNMSKLAADGNPILREDGKVLKGPGFFQPDLKKVLFGG